MTGRDLIEASLRLITALAPGENIEDGEAEDGLATVNRMISSWSNENLTIYAITEETFTLVANQQSYTMGSSGDFNTTRPLEIKRALLRDSTVSPSIDSPINIRTMAEWSRIPSKGVTSNYPFELYVEYTYPTATIQLYPKPTAAHTLVLYSLKELTQISTLSTSISLPPGYEEALVYNAAVRLAPEYGKNASQEIVAIALESKANIKRRNRKISLLRVDPAAQATGGWFNIFSGGWD